MAPFLSGQSIYNHLDDNDSDPEAHHHHGSGVSVEGEIEADEWDERQRIALATGGDGGGDGDGSEDGQGVRLERYRDDPEEMASSSREIGGGTGVVEDPFVSDPDTHHHRTSHGGSPSDIGQATSTSPISPALARHRRRLSSLEAGGGGSGSGTTGSGIAETESSSTSTATLRGQNTPIQIQTSSAMTVMRPRPSNSSGPGSSSSPRVSLAGVSAPGVTSGGGGGDQSPSTPIASNLNPVPSFYASSSPSGARPSLGGGGGGGGYPLSASKHHRYPIPSNSPPQHQHQQHSQSQYANPSSIHRVVPGRRHPYPYPYPNPNPNHHYPNTSGNSRQRPQPQPQTHIAAPIPSPTSVDSSSSVSGSQSESQYPLYQSQAQSQFAAGRSLLGLLNPTSAGNSNNLQYNNSAGGNNPNIAASIAQSRFGGGGGGLSSIYYGQAGEGPLFGSPPQGYNDYGSPSHHPGMGGYPGAYGYGPQGLAGTLLGGGGPGMGPVREEDEDEGIDGDGTPRAHIGGRELGGKTDRKGKGRARIGQVEFVDGGKMGKEDGSSSVNEGDRPGSSSGRSRSLSPSPSITISKKPPSGPEDEELQHSVLVDRPSTPLIPTDEIGEIPTTGGEEDDDPFMAPSVSSQLPEDPEELAPSASIMLESPAVTPQSRNPALARPELPQRDTGESIEGMVGETDEGGYTLHQDDYDTAMGHSRSSSETNPPSTDDDEYLGDYHRNHYQRQGRQPLLPHPVSTSPFRDAEGLRRRRKEEQAEQRRQREMIRDLPARDRALWKWVNVSDLDGFLQEVYGYYSAKGWQVILLKRTVELLTVGFVIGFSTFLMGCIDYSVIRQRNHLHEVVIKKCVSRLSGLTLFLAVLFGLFYLRKVVNFGLGAMKLWEMHEFFEELLGIPESELQTIPWHAVVSKLSTLRTQHPSALSSLRSAPQGFSGGNGSSMYPNNSASQQRDGGQRIDKLDAQHVANRIMRSENYLIALFNKDVLDLTVPIPTALLRVAESAGWDVLGKEEDGSQKKGIILGGGLTKALEWNLGFCLLGFLFGDNGQVRKQFVSERNRAALIEGLQRRFISMGVINAIFAPFIVLYLIMYSFFRYFEEYHNNPSSIGSRTYTQLARWKFREFNELPHIFQQRLHRSYEPADEYVDQFPKEKLALVARFVAFVAGSFAAVLVLFSLLDPDAFLHFEITPGGTVLFYIGIFGTILAVARGMVPDPHRVVDPEELMMAIAEHTHYLPAEWRGRLHSAEIHQEFSKLFDMKISIFGQELLSVILTPFILWFTLPACAPAIIDFFREFTIHVDGLGYVTSFAVFDFKRHGDVRFGAPVQERNKRWTERWMSNQGKMEKSLLNFKSHYPEWVPQDEAQSLFFSKMTDLNASIGPPTRHAPQPGYARGSPLRNQGLRRSVVGRSRFAAPGPRFGPDGTLGGATMMGMSTSPLVEEGSVIDQPRKAVKSTMGAPSGLQPPAPLGTTAQRAGSAWRARESKIAEKAKIYEEAFQRSTMAHQSRDRPGERLLGLGDRKSTTIPDEEEREDDDQIEPEAGSSHQGHAHHRPHPTTSQAGGPSLIGEDPGLSTLNPSESLKTDETSGLGEESYVTAGGGGGVFGIGDLSDMDGQSSLDEDGRDDGSERDGGGLKQLLGDMYGVGLGGGKVRW